MKPLVLFSSLAVLCASGLLALSYEGWQDDPSALTSLSSETKRVNIKPGVAVSTPPAVQPSTETQAETEKAAVKKVEEKVAAVDASETEPKPAVEPTPEIKLQEPEAKPEKVEVEPKGASFDIVRVEEDGSAVLAGRADPGDKVRLLINEEVAGETQANERGEWVIIPVNAMPAGAHQMQIETENASGEVKRADQSVALTVPEQPGSQPLIVLSETAKPSKVLQKPAAPEVKQAEVTQEAPSTESAAASGDTAESKVAEGEASSSTSTEQPAPETKTAALEPSVAAEQPTSVPTERKLTVDVVDYDEAGLTTFSGRSAPDSRVRVYVDNKFVGEAPAASDGTWSFTAGSEIASGPHTLRTDEIASSGKVNARIELPFFRESPERIASLQAQRNVASGQDSAKPEAEPEVAAEPEQPAKTVATDVAAEPDPVEETVAKTEVETTASDESVVASKPEGEATAAQEEKVAEPAQPATGATQQTSGLKADAEPVKSPTVPETSGTTTSQQVAAADTASNSVEPEASQQTAAVDTATEPAKSETSQQMAAVETATEPEKSETSQQTAAVETATETEKSETPQQTAAIETATEPAKSETSQQTAAVETATEPGKTDASQQTAAVETVTEPAKPETTEEVVATAPAAEQEKSEQEVLKSDTSEPATTSEPVETAAVTPEPEKTGSEAPATGRVVIQPGNNLWQISRVIYGRGRQYTVIYEANKTQIRDPDKIYPGQIFDTPGSNAPESIDPACRLPLAQCQ